MKSFIKIFGLIVLVLVIAGCIFCFIVGGPFINGKEDFKSETSVIPEQRGVPVSVKKGKNDWTKWRGDLDDNKVGIGNLNTGWSKGLNVLWDINWLCQGKNANTFSAPVVQGDHLVVMGWDEKNDFILCLNAMSEEIIWK